MDSTKRNNDIPKNIATFEAKRPVLPPASEPPPGSLGDISLGSLADIKNLMTAWKDVRSNKGAAGVDFTSLAEFEQNLMENLRELSMELIEHRYRPMPVRMCELPKKDESFRRIGIFTVKDRIAQRALLNLLEPLCENYFLDCSFGYRLGRSVQDAVLQVLQYRNRGYQWIVDADIQDFFHTMDHSILLRSFYRRVPNREILRLIRMWLEVPGRTFSNSSSESPPHRWISRIKAFLSDSVESAVSDFVSMNRGYPAVGEEDFEGIDPYRSLKEQAKREAILKLGKDAILLLLVYWKEVTRILSLRRILQAAGGLFVSSILLKRLGTFGASSRPALRGTVQGGAISPLLSNIYLHSLDTAFEKTPFRLVRYCDDFLILCRSEQDAGKALAYAQRVLGKLRLALHPSKTHIRRFGEKFEFLGYIFTTTGKVVPASPDVLRVDWSGLLEKKAELSRKAAATGTALKEKFRMRYRSLVLRFKKEG